MISYIKRWIPLVFSAWEWHVRRLLVRRLFFLHTSCSSEKHSTQQSVYHNNGLSLSLPARRQQRGQLLRYPCFQGAQGQKCHIHVLFIIFRWTGFVCRSTRNITTCFNAFVLLLNPDRSLRTSLKSVVCVLYTNKIFCLVICFVLKFSLLANVNIWTKVHM